MTLYAYQVDVRIASQGFELWASCSPRAKSCLARRARTPHQTTSPCSVHPRVRRRELWPRQLTPPLPRHAKRQRQTARRALGAVQFKWSIASTSTTPRLFEACGPLQQALRDRPQRTLQPSSLRAACVASHPAQSWLASSSDTGRHACQPGDSNRKRV